jgi:hypothetical protein
MRDIDEDMQEFRGWLDDDYGSIEIEGKTFKASEILEVFDKCCFDKAFLNYIAMKDNNDK